MLDANLLSGWCWLPADNSLSQYGPSDTDGTIESPQYSSKAATEVATAVTVLNVPKLADVPDPGRVPIGTTAWSSRSSGQYHSQPMHARVHAEVGLGAHSYANSS